jgi:hypothetical protein
MGKYPHGRHIHICQECGHPLGLKTPVWWRNIKLCSEPCKKLYRARWWRDWWEHWFNRLYRHPKSSQL